jgi:hypothetical protein
VDIQMLPASKLAAANSAVVADRKLAHNPRPKTLWATEA